ncbi:tumor necrosis factor receptor superfamily member 9a [Chanos chanos]|uniref:Tumor necrosis factor receptor superfamily member 9-like n=1 Tax=Chanos chanos TaxID=29144 RepID=A0A6J2UV09_CHACN|nr:tumor necrosis factor receptor superfamily member 9-like [Chanos chanos]XP_030622956.1 tumor necrosis factor receptor superfamily member 9-like [Chanos chanos]
MHLLHLVFLGLCHILIISSVNSTCADWIPSGNDVCCQKCSPGYRLRSQCGPDRNTLCVPCEPNNYITNPRLRYCRRCTQCIGPQIVVKECTASSDTVCGCRKGLHCGDNDCSFCVVECGKGQEPTEMRSCRGCPQGTFNDKIHHKCTPWRASCPDGQVIVAKGDAFSDIKCNSTSGREENSVEPSSPLLLPTGNKIGEGNRELTVVWIGAGSAVVLSVFIGVVVFALKTDKVRKKPVTAVKEELRKMEVEQEDRREDCSFHQPEQEQGSLDSLVSQDSEAKILPV